MSGVGSDSWLGVDEDSDPELRERATSFIASIKWDALVSLATQKRGIQCELSEGFSMGNFNLVRRLLFKDGSSWVVRLRLPDLPSIFGTRERLSAEESMSIEVATMKYIRLKTQIPVPEVFAWNLHADNEVGLPYILMEYLHGTVASELRALRECEPYVFGTAEQDARFWHQMAFIHVQLANTTHDKIGSLHQDEDSLVIGPELVTGKGPWTTSEDFYSTLAHHRLKAAEQDAGAEVRNKPSELPYDFRNLMKNILVHGEAQTKGPFVMANRDFGAHNVLVDNEFNIVGLIDFDGCMFAPIEVAAQFPLYMGLQRPVPGHVETRELALKRIEKQRHLIPRYVELVRAITTELERSTGAESASSLADALVGDAATVVQGLNEYGQHQDFVNDSWMAAYDLLMRKQEHIGRALAEENSSLAAELYHS